MVPSQEGLIAYEIGWRTSHTAEPEDILAAGKRVGASTAGVVGIRLRVQSKHAQDLAYCVQGVDGLAMAPVAFLSLIHI